MVWWQRHPSTKKCQQNRERD
ncbi:hypothetical protein RDI58_028668 [Solanum bulbocastanum]|uniref:Uncharacterized protein n=1 Tax=Solanum bulbocastanum TaxID=147425 RepID=A0AAN8SSB9_SOLBU